MKDPPGLFSRLPQLKEARKIKLRRIAQCLFLLLLPLLLLPGCGKQEGSPAPRIGVADSAALLQAHPLYESYAKKKQLLEGKRWAAEALGNLPPALVEASPLSASLPDGSGEAKAALLAADWQRRIEERRRQLLAQFESEYKAYQTELDKEMEASFFNLALRANSLALSAAEAAANEEAVNALKQERAAKLKVREQTLQNRIIAELAALERQARQESDAVHLQENRSQTSEAQTLPQSARPGKDNAALQELNALEKELSELENRMRREIEAAAAKAAEKQDIAVVFSQNFVGVNVSALDMTDSIIAEMAKQ